MKSAPLTAAATDRVVTRSADAAAWFTLLLLLLGAASLLDEPLARPCLNAAALTGLCAALSAARAARTVRNAQLRALRPLLAALILMGACSATLALTAALTP